MLDSVSFERGVHLRGSPLWFDAQRKRPLCVLTSFVGRLPPPHRRVVAHEKVAAALAAAGYRARVLPLPAGRWAGVGAQRLRFVTAHGLAATPVWLDVAGERILVTGLLGRDLLDWPAADHVVATVPALGHPGQPLDEVAAALVELVSAAEAGGERSTVVVDCVDAGSAVLTALRAAGLQPAPLGLLAKLWPPDAASAPGTTRGTAVPRLCLGAPRRRSGPLFFVDTGLGGLGAPPPRQVDQRLALHWFADAEQLGRLVQAVGAAAVSLVGTGGPLSAPAVAALGGVPWQLLAPQRQLELGA